MTCCMRILLTHHFPLDETAAGRLVTRLAQQLPAAGHEVRVLVVDDSLARPAPSFVRRLLCNPHEPQAELTFTLPRFANDEASELTFDQLGDDQLECYRESLRQALDDEVATFDPHVIHAQHLWIFGYLALEAGVPYVLTAYGPEIETANRDPRYRRYLTQAGENAGRILKDASLTRPLRFGSGEPEPLIEPQPQQVESQIAIYRDVLHARFGDSLRP